MNYYNKLSNNSVILKFELEKEENLVKNLEKYLSHQDVIQNFKGMLHTSKFCYSKQIKKYLVKKKSNL